VSRSAVDTYQWTDSYGREGRLAVLTDPAARLPVRVFTVNGHGPQLVAAVDRAGRPAWSTERLEASGVDTEAARNDLIETCRQAYLGLPRR
jgi:hypothetical protein